MTRKEVEARYRGITAKMMTILRDHKSAIDQYVDETRLHKSQHRLLMSLAALGDPVSQKKLADYLNITPAAVAVTLKKLEKNGLVTKTISNEDNRFNNVTITDKGKKIVKESQKVFQNTDDVMFKDFTEEEILQLEGFMDRMQKNLSDVL